MRRLMAAAALAATSALLLAGCSSDPLAEQYREGSGKNYIASDGTVSEYDASQRGDRITFSGPTAEGERFDSQAVLGTVTVVNFWYAGCAPCRVEAPLLEEVSQSFAGQDVSFVGVNLRDQAGTATSFQQAYGVSFPSILDVDAGTVQLAFAGDVPPAAVPTTIVLDRQGRVAARVLGQLSDASILRSIIDSLLAEKA